MEIIDFCSGRRSLAVVNKSDLGFVCDTDYIKSCFDAYVELSAKTAQGGGELEKCCPICSVLRISIRLPPR